MKKKKLYIAWGFLAVFLLFTAAVAFLDVAAIGPEGSAVGFASLNGPFHSLTGVRMQLYEITDWLGLIPVITVLAFALLGLVQWVRRRKLRLVDRSILALGIFYMAVAGAFLLFEKLAINYRPVLINGILEASYPSSTTLLVMCVMPTAILQLRLRIRKAKLRRWVCIVSGVYTALMVAARLLSGVHWLTDIIGGILLSTGLVLLYSGAAWGRET